MWRFGEGLGRLEALVNPKNINVPIGFSGKSGHKWSHVVKVIIYCMYDGTYLIHLSVLGIESRFK